MHTYPPPCQLCRIKANGDLSLLLIGDVGECWDVTASGCGDWLLPWTGGDPGQQPPAIWSCGAAQPELQEGPHDELRGHRGKVSKLVEEYGTLQTSYMHRNEHTTSVDRSLGISSFLIPIADSNGRQRSLLQISQSLRWRATSPQEWRYASTVGG